MRNLLFLFLFAPALAFATQGNPGLGAISQALSSGDVETLSKYFADNVEISIMDDEQLYPKAKAKAVVQKFFGTNKPKSFQQVHQGTSRGNDDHYCIGNLSASSGSYRVYLYMKTEGGKLQINEIRFDEE